MKYIEIIVRNTVCGDCKHFYRHYVKSGLGYVPCNYGHCCYPRVKGRIPEKAACKHFEFEEPLVCVDTGGGGDSIKQKNNAPNGG